MTWSGQDDNEKQGKNSGAAGEKPEEIAKTKPSSSDSETETSESSEGVDDAEQASIKRGLVSVADDR